jgi:hypothetical protein
MSALVAAAQSGDIARVQRLLKGGASVSELSTAMLVAIDNGHISATVKCLIKEGDAHIDAVIAAGWPAKTALALAAGSYGNYPLVQWLIDSRRARSFHSISGYTLDA